MKILTGIQPSGQLHLGNYFGAMKPMIDMMNSGDHEVFCFLANYHALTSVQDAATIRNHTRDAILDWMACGLDPQKIVFYVQSDLPEVQELAWLLHCLTPMGLLERATSYKDKVAKGIAASSGLFTYPVLMAADILIMQADVVPVGKDQKQHIEIARDLAEKFNHQYGETFVLPQELISDDLAIVPGVDGQKMSKSYGNTIPLFAEESVIRKKIMGIVTDSASVEAAKDPEKCNIFALYRLVSTADEQAELAARYRAGGMGYGEAKNLLWQAVQKYFSPMWEKRKVLAADRELIERVRQEGAEKARRIARKTMEKARKKTGLL